MTPIDEYLAKVEPAKRKELERIRALAKKAVPEAEETIGYGMPTLKYQGKPFLGFDAHANHIGVYPYSGRVIETLSEELRAYETTKGAIRGSARDDRFPNVPCGRLSSAGCRRYAPARRRRSGAKTAIFAKRVCRVFPSRCAAAFRGRVFPWGF